MSEYIINAFSFPDGPAPQLQTVSATNIYQGTSDHINGWSLLSSSIGIENATGNIMSVRDGSGVLVFSDDNGGTWVEKSAPNAVTTNSILHDGNNTWYITNGDFTGAGSRHMKIYYSTDDGDTWTVMDNDPYVNGYGLAISMAANGNIIFTGRRLGYNQNKDAATIYTNPPTNAANNFNAGWLFGGGGYHSMESGGYYFASAGTRGLIRIDPTISTAEYMSVNNTVDHGWASDGLGTIFMPDNRTQYDTTPPYNTNMIRLTTTSINPHEEEVFTFPYQLDSTTAAYGNGMYLFAGCGNGSNDKKVHIFMSDSGEPGTFSYEISLELSTERFSDPSSALTLINIRHYKDDTWIITYISSLSATPAFKWTIDTFEFIPIL